MNKIVAGLLLSIALPAIAVSAQMANMGTSTGTFAQPANTSSGLSLSAVRVDDINTINLIFSKPVEPDTLRVRITNQRSGEVVRIVTTEPARDGTQGVLAKTPSPLTAGDSYVLTVLSVTSTDGAMIQSGVDSIKEFVVPRSIPGSTLAAPANPNAVLVTTGAAVTTGSTNVTPVVSSGNTNNTGSVAPKAEVLPATGAEFLWIILLAVLVSGVMFARRHKA